MERVSEVLQLPVVVQGRRTLSFELEAPEKFDFLRGRGTAEGRILKELLETGLVAGGLSGLPLDELESLRLPRDDVAVQDDLQTERRQVDVPGLDQRIQERDAVLSGQV